MRPNIHQRRRGIRANIEQRRLLDFLPRRESFPLGQLVKKIIAQPFDLKTYIQGVNPMSEHSPRFIWVQFHV
jgi:hypothetical protein